MRVTVNVRPWIQNRNTGAVVLEHEGQPGSVREGIAADVQPAAR